MPSLAEKLNLIQDILKDILENEINIKGKTHKELVDYNKKLAEKTGEELNESAALIAHKED